MTITGVWIVMIWGAGLLSLGLMAYLMYVLIRAEEF